jgi:hypothetical protein
MGSFIFEVILRVAVLAEAHRRITKYGGVTFE